MSGWHRYSSLLEHIWHKFHLCSGARCFSEGFLKILPNLKGKKKTLFCSFCHIINQDQRGRFTWDLYFNLENSISYLRPSVPLYAIWSAAGRVDASRRDSPRIYFSFNVFGVSACVFLAPILWVHGACWNRSVMFLSVLHYIKASVLPTSLFCFVALDKHTHNDSCLHYCKRPN